MSKILIDLSHLVLNSLCRFKCAVFICSAGAQCKENEVFVAHGSVAVLPCRDETSAHSHPTAVYWSRIVGK